MLTGRIEKAVQHSGKDKIPKALKRQRKKRPKRKDQKGLVGTHMKLQRLLSLTRQALDTYGLIQDGDRIAIGVSGGKDSLTLLHALHHLRRFYPEKYELCAITVDLGLGNMDLEPVAAMCREFEIPYEIISTEIGVVLFDIRKETNPCSLCAKMRKGALNEKAKEMGCNKIAYAHHRDDVIETMMMSLFYEGRFHSFSPLTYLDRMDLTVIRPMIFVTEADVIGFRNKYQLPVCKNPCPMDGYTKRQYIKELIHRLQEDNPHIKDCMFRAILDGSIKGWPQALK